MSQIMKRKVIRNRGKRAKIGSHGFKVYKNTYVYIAKYCSSSKPAPKEEVVIALQNHFNSSKSIRKMVKHIKGIKYDIPTCCIFWFTDVYNSIQFILDTEFRNNWYSERDGYIRCPNYVVDRMEELNGEIE